MDKQLINFNAGSSSLKIGFFAYDGEQIVKFSRGEIDLNCSPLTLSLRGELYNFDIVLDTSGAGEIAVIFEELLSRLSTHTNLSCAGSWPPGGFRR
ncbi:hypothetical protein [Brucella pseudogrignonensis]|uniref:hypothetical protein n=1 Tax=Brucella pseudogrignonensis TaxID=419475 RepID=UPI000CFE30C8|nr:hypothetical protein [Brucella pseudogrignonensis]MQP40418.1 hypothetical protein [Ochrobactrum sp. MYb237]PQZ39493.1 hypothetical protein CQ059_23270 [Brucella pseudogrignonensis]PRA41004.1 hypothetical protein CQ063_10765 [Brucella pseudogrignonensis]PRA69830.1 hypothetical protein CQ055_10650 [Brucella pseudogrignonensis]